jgi:site-specific DNA recombinase
VIGVEQIAVRQKSIMRLVNMTISLAFLAPDLVRAAVESAIGVERLRDAPAEWSRPFEALG